VNLKSSGGEQRRLEQKVAVVTGSSSGIGKAIAELFAREGAALVLVDQNGTANEALVRELRNRGSIADAFTVDLESRDETVACIDQISDRHPVVDILVNNAGAILVEPIATTSLRMWDQMHNLHLAAPFLFIRGLIPSMKRSAGASIINNASVDGLYAHPLMPAYGTAKGGLLALTRSCAFELGSNRIRINCIATGGIDTPMIRGLTDRARDELAKATPLRRLGTPEEVAQVALFLGTSDSSFVTGAIITVDGGRTAITAAIASLSDPDLRIGPSDDLRP
jgi:NAD(P)-dependent dehydrogenase (short-subunit alcohol dehydrogenase family)